MTTIYEPKGKAYEYSPLALNIYEGCDNGCFYCYVPAIMGRFRPYEHNKVKQKINFISELKRTVKNYMYSENQVLLSFTCDAYCDLNNSVLDTKRSLEILLENKIPVSILTKKTNVLNDIDVFKKFKGHIMVGMTLTYDNEKDSIKNECNASVPDVRLETLKKLKENNINTWASFEPVLDSEQSKNMMLECLQFVDVYKIGKLNHRHSDINWTKFLYESMEIMESNNKQFYIKKDLQEFDIDNKLKDYNKNPFNFYAKKFEKEEQYFL